MAVEYAGGKVNIAPNEKTKLIPQDRTHDRIRRSKSEFFSVRSFHYQFTNRIAIKPDCCGFCSRPAPLNNIAIIIFVATEYLYLMLTVEKFIDDEIILS